MKKWGKTLKLERNPLKWLKKRYFLNGTLKLGQNLRKLEVIFLKDLAPLPPPPRWYPVAAPDIILHYIVYDKSNTEIKIPRI